MAMLYKTCYDEGGDPELEQQLFQRKHDRPAPTVCRDFSGRSTLLSQFLVWLLGFCLLVLMSPYGIVCDFTAGGDMVAVAFTR